MKHQGKLRGTASPLLPKVVLLASLCLFGAVSRSKEVDESWVRSCPAAVHASVAPAVYPTQHPTAERCQRDAEHDQSSASTATHGEWNRRRPYEPAPDARRRRPEIPERAWRRGCGQTCCVRWAVGRWWPGAEEPPHCARQLARQLTTIDTIERGRR